MCAPNTAFQMEPAAHTCVWLGAAKNAYFSHNWKHFQHVVLPFKQKKNNAHSIYISYKSNQGRFKLEQIVGNFCMSGLNLAFGIFNWNPFEAINTHFLNKSRSTFCTSNLNTQSKQHALTIIIWYKDYVGQTQLTTRRLALSRVICPYWLTSTDGKTIDNWYTPLNNWMGQW